MKSVLAGTPANYCGNRFNTIFQDLIKQQGTAFSTDNLTWH